MLCCLLTFVSLFPSAPQSGPLKSVLWPARLLGRNSTYLHFLWNELSQLLENVDLNTRQQNGAPPHFHRIVRLFGWKFQ
jgi:hypothetical protein